MNLTYRPPKREITNKELVLVGDLNINALDFNEGKTVQNFVNLTFPHGLIPNVNKPTRVTRNTHSYCISSQTQ